MTDNFPACFEFTVGAEGGFTDVASDSGNWSGGIIGAGSLNGTNWGISAAAYPTLNIKSLTQADAAAIYRRDYYAKIQGDTLPLPLAYVAFDAAVNSGVARSIMWLQAAAGVRQDAYLGPVTLAALGKGDAAAMAQEALVRRLVYISGLPSWGLFGLGWTRRVMALRGVIAVS